MHTEEMEDLQMRVSNYITVALHVYRGALTSDHDLSWTEGCARRQDKAKKVKGIYL